MQNILTPYCLIDTINIDTVYFGTVYGLIQKASKFVYTNDDYAENSPNLTTIKSYLR